MFKHSDWFFSSLINQKICKILDLYSLIGNQIFLILKKWTIQIKIAFSEKIAFMKMKKNHKNQKKSKSDQATFCKNSKREILSKFKKKKKKSAKQWKKNHSHSDNYFNDKLEDFRY